MPRARTLLAMAMLLPAAGGQEPVFRADSQLALVRFQVSPRAGEFITDLQARDIQLLEDGIPQRIVHFEGGRFYPRNVPLEVDLLFDCSTSVQAAGKLDPYLFDGGLMEEFGNASIALYAFNDNLTRVLPPTRSTAALRRAMDGVAAFPSGHTPLFDAIARTLRDAAKSGPRTLRILVVVSDGESTVPGDTLLDAAAARTARELGIAIYPVLLTEAGAVGAMSRHIESVRKFSDLARATGGEVSAVLTAENLLPQILRAMAKRLQFDYVAGYYPADSDGKAHDVQIAWSGRSRGSITGGIRTVTH
jgi:VWFA-related protein